jgi:hypothetical protein
LDKIILSKFNPNHNNFSPSTGGGRKTLPSLTIEVDVPEISPNVVTPDYDNFNHTDFDSLRDHLTRVFTEIETITRCDFGEEGSMWKITVQNKLDDDHKGIISDPERHFVWYYSNEAIRKKCSKNPNNPFRKDTTYEANYADDIKTVFNKDAFENFIGLAALGYTNNGGKTKRKRKTKRKQSLYRKPKKRSNRSRNKIRKKSRNKK